MQIYHVFSKYIIFLLTMVQTSTTESFDRHDINLIKKINGYIYLMRENRKNDQDIYFFSTWTPNIRFKLACCSKNFNN